MIDFHTHMDKFSNFVDGFVGSKDPVDRENITLKKNHSQRVYQEAKSLTRDVDAPAENIQLARLTALYHDIGRFPQYARYGSFDDKTTINHGLIGYKTLRKYSFLSDLSIPERKMVFFGVLNHNRAKIPPYLPENYDFILKVVRDSDKLDIMNVLLEYFADENNSNSVVTLGLKPDPERYSPQVVDALLSGKMADYKDLVWINDFKFMLLSWVFDFNFSHTQAQVKTRGYLESILELLPDTTEVREVRERIYTHMDSSRALA